MLLHAALFDSVVLVPAPGDSARAGEWENLVVRFGDDTLAVRRISDTTLAVNLTQVYSGTYVIEVLVESNIGRVARPTVDVYGLHEPAYWADISFWETYSLTEAIPWPPGNLLSYNSARQAVVTVDLLYGSVAKVAGLHFRAWRESWTGMLAPGVSYRVGHAVLDLGDTNALPAVWQVPRQPIHPSACADTAAWRMRQVYDVADLSGGHCLGVHELRVNNAHLGLVVNERGDGLVPPDSALFRASVRIAPGGSQAVLLAARSRSGCRCVLDGWPVFDSSANLQYSIPEYAQVPGAEFSADGLVLYVAGDLNVELDQVPGNGYSVGPWVLDVRNASDGELVERRELDELQLIHDILLDPIFPRVYVAGVDADRDGVLLVLDRPTLEEIARVRVRTHLFDLGMLVYGGSNGSIFLAHGIYGHDAGIGIVRFDIMP